MDTSALRGLLITWAEINSGSQHIAGLERMRTALAAEFATLPGASVEHLALPGTAAQALRIRVRREAPLQILFSGHYDTVYAAEHPFQHCTLLDAQTLRGPGVADMKGGLLVILAALREFEQSPAAARLGYEILLTPDEETGSVASRPLLEAAARSRHFACGLVFEPARPNGDLVRSRKGTGIFTITCHGRAAHAGRDPSAGRNAILALAEYLLRLDALNREIKGVMLNVGHIRGGGAVNIVPDLASADVNIRTTRASDETLILGRLRALATPINSREGYRLEISGRFNRPPKEVTPAEERLFTLWQRCAREQGCELSWQDVAGGSDGNLLAAAGLPCLDGLGVVGNHLHSPEECVRLPSVRERADIAAKFLEQVATGTIVL